MPVYEVEREGGREPTIVNADAVRVSHGDLVFSRRGLECVLIARGAWSTCQESQH